MKEIPLTQGKVALVDDEDYDWLMQWKWCAALSRGSRNWYAVAYINGKRTLMHRFIMNAQKGQTLDHINGDGLYNCKSNLRFCTPTQNTQNQKLRENTSSKYKGVSWYLRAKKWQASIMYNKKYIHLGHFTDEEKAARAYDNAAVVLFKEFARLNFRRRIPRKHI